MTKQEKIIEERRRRAMRDVIDVCIFLDGVNGAGEEVHTDYILTESPGWDPIQLFIDYARGGTGYLVEETYGPGAGSPARYQSLTIAVHVGLERDPGVVVDGLKLNDLDEAGVNTLLGEIAEMLGQADDDGVKIPDAVQAWEASRAAPAV